MEKRKNYKINDEQKLKLMTEFIKETGQKLNQIHNIKDIT